MTKLKVVIGLSAIVAAVAILPAPASAWFTSLNGKTQGQAKIPGLTIKIGGSLGDRVVCETPNASWHLQSKGKIEEPQTKGNREATTKGPNLDLKVSKWSNCKGLVGLNTPIEGIEAKACEYQLEQPKNGVDEGTISIPVECVTKFTKPACEIIIPAAKEKEKVNYQTKLIATKNSGKNVLASVRVGIEPLKVEACSSGKTEFAQLETVNEFSSTPIILEELEVA